MEAPLNRLRILQINLNKSEKGHLDLINKPLDRAWDIILVQEPHILWNRLTRAPNNFTTIYPQEHFAANLRPVRSIIFINTNLLSSSWRALDVVGTPDVTGVQLNIEGRLLSIFNVYFDCKDMATAKLLRRYLTRERAALRPGDDDQLLVAGDFNSHHQLWDRDEDHRLFTPEAARRAEQVLLMAADEGLVMALPRGLPTLKHFRTKLYSRPDNVWCSEGLSQLVVRCDVDNYLQPPFTDHFPIITIVDLPQRRVVSTP